jgi:hypothetical protein
LHEPGKATFTPERNPSPCATGCAPAQSGWRQAGFVQTGFAKHRGFKIWGVRIWGFKIGGVKIGRDESRTAC